MTKLAWLAVMILMICPINAYSEILAYGTSSERTLDGLAGDNISGALVEKYLPIQGKFYSIKFDTTKPRQIVSAVYNATCEIDSAFLGVSIYIDNIEMRPEVVIAGVLSKTQLFCSNAAVGSFVRQAVALVSSPGIHTVTVKARYKLVTEGWAIGNSSIVISR